jgi:hypothetical protein
MALTFDKKNDFIVANATDDVKTYERDLALYKKIYSNRTRQIAEFERANEFNRKSYNGRILMEILDVVCGETVLESRGIIADIESKKQENHKNVDNDLIKELLATDLSVARYAVIKSLFLRLGLQSKIKSDAVIRPMLIEHKANLQPTSKPTDSKEEANNEPQTQESNTPGDEPNQGANGMPKVDVEDTEKKKEEQPDQE